MDKYKISVQTDLRISSKRDDESLRTVSDKFFFKNTSVFSEFSLGKSQNLEDKFTPHRLMSRFQANQDSFTGIPSIVEYGKNQKRAKNIYKSYDKAQNSNKSIQSQDEEENETRKNSSEQIIFESSNEESDSSKNMKKLQKP